MRILFPLPTRGFDPTETAVPWWTLTSAGHEVVFATPDGQPSAADARMVDGHGFGPLRRLFQARPHARMLYSRMHESAAFVEPVPYATLESDDFDGVLLAGGHDKAMRSYLEAPRIQALCAMMMRAEKPVAAICHGVLVLARAIDPETGDSVLRGYRTTALSKAQELGAWVLTALWLDGYFRTYARTVQDEVEAALAEREDFVPGPMSLRREDLDRPDVGFVVRDRNYVSARSYVDAYRFAEAFAQVLEVEASQRRTWTSPRT